MCVCVCVCDAQSLKQLNSVCYDTPLLQLCLHEGGRAARRMDENMATLCVWGGGGGGRNWSSVDPPLSLQPRLRVCVGRGGSKAWGGGPITKATLTENHIKPNIAPPTTHPLVDHAGGVCANFYGRIAATDLAPCLVWHGARQHV